MKLTLALGMSAALISFSGVVVSDAYAGPHRGHQGRHGHGVHHGHGAHGGRGMTVHRDGRHVGAYHNHGHHRHYRGYNYIPLAGAVWYGSTVSNPNRYYDYCEVNYKGYLYRGTVGRDGYCYVNIRGRWTPFSW